MKYGRDRGRRLAPPRAIPRELGLFRQALLESGAGVVSLSDAREPAEHFAELVELVPAEVLLHEFADRPDVGTRGGLEPFASLRRELGVRDAKVGRARRASHEARPFEPLEEAGDAGGAE